MRTVCVGSGYLAGMFGQVREESSQVCCMCKTTSPNCAQSKLDFTYFSASGGKMRKIGSGRIKSGEKTQILET